MKRFNIPMKTKTKIKCIFTTLLLCLVMCVSLFALSAGVSAEMAVAEPGNGESGPTTQSTFDLTLNSQIQIVSFGGHTYQLFDTETTWSNAKGICESLGGHLVTITSAAEQQQLFNSFHEKAGSCWIGAYPDQNLNWHWVTSESFSYSNWCYQGVGKLRTNHRGAIYMSNGSLKYYMNGEPTGESYDVNAGQWAFLVDPSPNGNYCRFICEWDNQSIPLPGAGLSLDAKDLNLWADPIDTSTGAHIINHSYLTQYGSDLEFSFELHYDGSRLTEGDLGIGWYHNYEKRIEPQSDGTLRYYTSPSTYIIFGYDGYDYVSNMPGKMGWIIEITSGSGLYHLDMGADGEEVFSPDGELCQILRHDGRSLVINKNNNTTTVTESVSGKSLTLRYNADGRITQVSGATPTGTGTVQFTYNSNNHLTAITEPNNKTVRYTYDGDGRVLTGTDGDNICYFTDTYENGRVVKQVDGRGNSTLFSYAYPSTGNSVVTITDRRENTVVHTYNEDRRLIQARDQDGNVKTYAYDYEGNITEETDGNGNTTVKTYNDDNQVITKTDPLGGVKTYTYDSNQNLLCQENPDGGELSFTYRPNNQVATSTDERGNTTTYTYNAYNLLTNKTLDNNTTEYTYSNGKVRTITDPKGGVTTYTYTASGLPSTLKDANGNTTSYTYDAKGNLLSQKDGEGNETKYTYDSRGNILTQTDGNGNITRYVYNGNGKVVSATNANGKITKYAYNGEDQLAGIEDPQGNTETRTYTKTGLLNTVKNIRGKVTSYTYDGVGNLLTEKAPLGGVITKTYDANNNLKTEKDPAGNVPTYTYNSMGRVTKETNAYGKNTVYRYNEAGDLLSVTDPLGHTTSYTYDAFGNKLAETDSNGNTTQYGYDANNNLIKKTDALGYITTYAYDPLGQLVSTTDAKNHTTNYTYNKAGRMTGVTDPLGYTTTVAYDENGNITASTDALG